MGPCPPTRSSTSSRTSRTWPRSSASRRAWSRTSRAVPLELEQSGVSYFRIAPGFRTPFGHVHSEQEEVYVVASGSARVELGDEVLELAQWDAVRIARATMRGFEGGPEGAEVLAFGAPNTENKDAEMVQGWWADVSGRGTAMPDAHPHPARAEPRAARPPGPARAQRDPRAGACSSGSSACRRRCRRTRTSRCCVAAARLRPARAERPDRAARAPCARRRCARRSTCTRAADCLAIQPVTQSVLDRTFRSSLRARGWAASTPAPVAAAGRALLAAAPDDARGAGPASSRRAGPRPSRRRSPRRSRTAAPSCRCRRAGCGARRARPAGRPRARSWTRRAPRPRPPTRWSSATSPRSARPPPPTCARGAG